MCGYILFFLLDIKIDNLYGKWVFTWLSPVMSLMVSYFVLTFFPTRCWGGGGWSGEAMALGKLPVPGRPTNLEYSRARAYCAYSRCGWGLFGHFSLICHFSLLSPSLWETARYRLKYCLKGPLNPKQPTSPRDVLDELSLVLRIFLPTLGFLH